MDYISKLKRVEYIRELIEKEKAESPKQLAEKLGCSDKTVRNIINALRDEGIDICYCKAAKKYLLKENCLIDDCNQEK